MALRTIPPRVLLLSVVLLAAPAAGAGTGSEFDDGTSPKFPGCDNTLQKVKVTYWVDGDERSSLTGISARFGAVLPDAAPDDEKQRAAVPSPESGCAKSSAPLAGSVAVAVRGECTFIEKAKAAEAGGAVALLLVNDEDDLQRMVCSDKDSPPNIGIPVVMVSKSAGDKVQSAIGDGSKGEIASAIPSQCHCHSAMYARVFIHACTTICMIRLSF